MTTSPLVVTVAIEGPGDVPLVERLLETVGLDVGNVYVLGGKATLDRRLAGFNHAARHAQWLVLRDLDSDAACAPELKAELLPTPGAHMCFRIAVRAAEAWLLADRERIAPFLGIPRERVSAAPESLDDPKQAVVNLARRSRFRAIRADMVPATGTSARVGPGYTSRIVEFARDHWRPKVAARHSPSLAACVRSLERLGKGGGGRS
jgi:hypothetical protein